MKKVLIIGINSYIGRSFMRYAQGRLDIKTVSSRNDEWRKADYTAYDCVLYAAGIAHQKQIRTNMGMYYTVNRNMAYEAATMAKAQSTSHFIYLSSMAVYGLDEGEITSATLPSPRANDHYGISKYQAENLINPLQSDDMKITVIRPPMVYGPNCPGNFPRLVKLAKIMPLLPTLDNKRSMIYIDNLSEFLAIVIEQGISGTLCPQNAEHVHTAQMMGVIRQATGTRIRRQPLLNAPILALIPVTPPLKKAFGSLYYSFETPETPARNAYQVVRFEESVERSL